jgi:26S proteasome regulatory subunit N7
MDACFRFTFFFAASHLITPSLQVGGKVETNPPDDRNAQYQTMVKKGDLLLTNIQKLARVIDA